MADESIGEAAAATAAEGGAVVLIPNAQAEAAEHGESMPEAPPALEAMIQAHDERMAVLEQRMVDIEAEQAAVRIEMDGKALASHEHAPDEDLAIIADELKALREEEVAPRRGKLPGRGWLRRKLRGQA